jgi:ABC-2 type transport system ATP-binding protein
MELFRTENIVKRFAEHQALTDVSISVPEGQIFGLLGPNGAGKTTLIRIITQITAPDSGEVFFNGSKLKAKHVAEVGYLPEERGLYKKMKIGEQALYLAQLKGLTKHDAMQKLKYWFEKFEIQDWWGKKVEELSKGMQQKVQFIVTVLHEPKLLIFDEPFSGFDPINANLLKQEILNLKAKGSTIIFSTHNMSSVEELCDKIALINKSRKILEGNVVDVKSHYKSKEFEVCFDGYFDKIQAAMTTNYKMIDLKQDKNLTRLRVQLQNGYTVNELIGGLLNYGNIVSFSEVVPSMNDIFIRVVEEYNKNFQQ